jgi:putative addiction module component (TIGR02574 family)
MDLNKVTHDALSLSVRERGLLATRLLDSIESVESTDVQAQWLDLAEERLREIDEGRVEAVSEEEVEQRIRARLK